MDENLIGLIMAVAVVFVLMVLLFNLFSPIFDKEDKMAESYFESLDRAIETAESGGEGDFFMMNNENEDLEFYVAYFGSVASFREDERNFIRSEQGENVVCVCYFGGGNVVCNYCEDLKLPVQRHEGDNIKSSSWIIKEGERMRVVKQEGYYEFAKI